MRKVFCWVFLASLLVVFLGPAFEIRSVRAGYGTIVVPDDFPRIQEAINNAMVGDTVFVRSGVYLEHLIINKTVALVGEDRNGVVVESGKDEDAITVNADNVSISNLVVRNAVNTTSSFGIRLSNSSYCSISNNVILDTFAAVMIEGGSHNLVQSNFIDNNRYGIFTRHYLQVYASYDNVIYNNTVLNSFWNAIELDWGGGNLVSCNNVVNNTAYGFEIPIYAPSFNNVIFHNSFIDNAKALGVTCQAYGPSPNYWDVDGEGNYWSDYVGSDLYNGPFQNITGSDGVGDSAHVSQEDTTDHYPLMGIFYATTVNEIEVSVICNSKLTQLGFSVQGSQGNLSVVVFQETNSSGFCRFSLPKVLITGPYTVRVDNQTISYPQVRTLSWPDETRQCFYVEYPAGKHQVEIMGKALVPEFPSLLMFLFLFFVASCFVLLFRKKTDR